MLVVAKDTTHAEELLKDIEADTFFEGRYKGRVITVHSNQSGEEKDETVQQLLSVEDPANATEIVIHVNMLKEGWDVTNLYTIVPLRAANSKTLVEQSIGRGLRLPYGKRTGVADVDRLTIVSHDRFQEIVDHANDPNSIIRTGVVIGRDIPDKPTQAVTISPTILSVLGIAPQSAPGDATQVTSAVQQPLFKTEPERRLRRQRYEVIHREFERLTVLRN
jgi:type III restriction enzyme